MEVAPIIPRRVPEYNSSEAELTDSEKNSKTTNQLASGILKSKSKYPPQRKAPTLLRRTTTINPHSSLSKLTLYGIPAIQSSPEITVNNSDSSRQSDEGGLRIHKKLHLGLFSPRFLNSSRSSSSQSSLSSPVTQREPSNMRLELDSELFNSLKEAAKETVYTDLDYVARLKAYCFQVVYNVYKKKAGKKINIDAFVDEVVDIIRTDCSKPAIVIPSGYQRIQNVQAKILCAGVQTEDSKYLSDRFQQLIDAKSVKKLLGLLDVISSPDELDLELSHDEIVFRKLVKICFGDCKKHFEETIKLLKRVCKNSHFDSLEKQLKIKVPEWITCIKHTDKTDKVLSKGFPWKATSPCKIDEIRTDEISRRWEKILEDTAFKSFKINGKIIDTNELARSIKYKSIDDIDKIYKAVILKLISAFYDSGISPGDFSIDEQLDFFLELDSINTKREKIRVNGLRRLFQAYSIINQLNGSEREKKRQYFLRKLRKINKLKPEKQAVSENKLFSKYLNYMGKIVTLDSVIPCYDFLAMTTYDVEALGGESLMKLYPRVFSQGSSGTAHKANFKVKYLSGTDCEIDTNKYEVIFSQNAEVQLYETTECNALAKLSTRLTASKTNGGWEGKISINNFVPINEEYCEELAKELSNPDRVAKKLLAKDIFGLLHKLNFEI